MSEPISYEGSELTTRIPGLFEVQDALHSYTAGLNGELATIGPMFDHIADELSATIYTTYTKQMGMVNDTFSALGTAVGVHGERMVAAAGDHQRSEDVNTDNSTWEGGHR